MPTNEKEPSLKIAFFLNEEDRFVPYKKEDLKNDKIFEKLNKSARLYDRPDFSARRVKAKSHKKYGTRYFQRNGERIELSNPKLTIEKNLILHRQHVDFSIDILNSAKAFRTVIRFDDNKPVERKIIKNIENFEWIAERQSEGIFIIPDISGIPRIRVSINLKADFVKALGAQHRRSIDTIFNHVARHIENSSKPNSSLNYSVMVEIINQSPPTQKKWKSLITASLQHGVLIVFNILVDRDPTLSKIYFRSCDDGMVDCSFYIKNGYVYKNGKQKHKRYDHTDFSDEVQGLQRNKGFIE